MLLEARVILLLHSTPTTAPLPCSLAMFHFPHPETMEPLALNLPLSLSPLSLPLDYPPVTQNWGCLLLQLGVSVPQLLLLTETPGLWTGILFHVSYPGNTQFQTATLINNPILSIFQVVSPHTAVTQGHNYRYTGWHTNTNKFPGHTEDTITSTPKQAHIHSHISIVWGHEYKHTRWLTNTFTYTPNLTSLTHTAHCPLSLSHSHIHATQPQRGYICKVFWITHHGSHSFFLTQPHH